MAKIITVFGLTGNQGGSVIRAILRDPELSRSWKVRGITRDPSKPNAIELSQQGVHMVAADLSNRSSILQAIQGSDAVFGVTNYWEKGTLEYEVMQGKNLADAAKEAEVGHLIWSSLPFVSEVTKGRLHNLHHFDSKAIVEKYIRHIGLPASFVMPGYFMSNIPGSIQPSTDGRSYSISWVFDPDTQIPMLDVPSDFGKFVAACLLHPAETIGSHVMAASGWFTPLDVAKAVQSCTGIECRYHVVPLRAFHGSPELLDNLLMIKDYDYYGPGAHDGVKRSQELVGRGVKLSAFTDFFRDIGV